jgi:tripartite-type tricarboxylate transporter receptor subunit TctC
MSRKLMGIAAFVWLAVLVAGFASVQYAAAADKYPARPVDLLVPSGPGGGADQIARLISPLMEKQFKTPFPVSNLPGAGGNAALSKLIASKPDGYSVSIFMGRIVCSWATVGLGDFKIEDFAWLSRLIKQESAFFVKYDSPIKDAQDLFRIAKEKSLKVAIHGHGNLDDISVRYLVSQGFKLVGVPFAKPSERYMAPLGGHVDLLYEEPGDVKSFIDAKQLRPILLFSQKRSKFFPDVPTTYELGYKIGFPNWRGVVVKSGTPAEVVKSLEDALKKMTETPEWQKYLVDEMAEPDSFLGPAAFQPSVYEEFKVLDAFAKQYGIK